MREVMRSVGGLRALGQVSAIDSESNQYMLTMTDKCLNYKDSDFEEQLEKATGGQTDIYFDNVAGEILDSMLAKMKQGGVIVACGGVSGYNDKNPTMLKRKLVPDLPDWPYSPDFRRLHVHRVPTSFSAWFHCDGLPS